MKKAVFLDKDGTLIYNIPYNADPEKIRLADFVGEGLQLLFSQGYHLIVISNQSGVALGYFQESDLQYVYKRLQKLLLPYHAPLHGFYYCPHSPHGVIQQYKKVCTCRKPSPGLLVQASTDYGISLSDSWFIGDVLHDVEAGRRAGCKTILITDNSKSLPTINKLQKPDYVATTFLEAAKLICYE